MQNGVASVQPNDENWGDCDKTQTARAGARPVVTDDREIAKTNVCIRAFRAAIKNTFGKEGCNYRHAWGEEEESKIQRCVEENMRAV